MKPLFRIKEGGIHPDDNKRHTAEKIVETMPPPSRLIVPVRQHIGAPCVPIIEVGALVKKGQIIASQPEKKAPPIHAPTSGIVKEIGDFPHPVFGIGQSIVIEADQQDVWLEGLLQERSFDLLSEQEMLEYIYQGGVVGLGGAAFPTHLKLQPPKTKKIDTLIINAAECEPYLTADYRVLVENAPAVITGCRIIMKILHLDTCFVGIEDNKPQAIAAIGEAGALYGIKAIPLKTIYPQGGEKMLIHAITGRAVPSGKLPMDVGCVVQNAATCVAITNAVIYNKPLIERVVTVSGKAIKIPKNILVRIGTLFDDAIKFCDGLKATPGKVIMGGPLMGIAQAGTSAPIVKATSGILVLTKQESARKEDEPCIRCGRCVEACTMKLRPNMLSTLSEKQKHQTAMAEYGLLDCVECGCCTYVCPAKRNIVHYIKLSKARNAGLRK